MPVKKTTKKAAKKTAAKKAPAKKTAVKKAAKKAPAKASTSSTSSGQASSAQKKAAKKTPAKKAPAKKVAKTSIIARVDVGFGNQLYVRGEGAGLSWDKGVLMKNVSPYEWAFETTKASGEVSFKFLLNDEAWAEGDNLSVAAGGESVSSPVFSW